MNLQEANEYLDSLNNSELFLGSVSSEDFSLNNIETLLSKFGNPHNNLRVVHVAGSKGKGSTCAFIANILKEAGYKVGLYTSPHFYDRRERIRFVAKDSIRGKDADLFRGQISENELCVLVEMLKPYAEKLEGISFFEVFTAIAILFFNHMKPDVVILETGLGGRLDATNVVDAEICAVTPISLEHTNLLGHSLLEIACEKAAIIKGKEKKVIIASQKKETFDVIKSRCEEVGISFCEGATDSSIDAYSMSLKGDHQKKNASVAIEVINALKEQGLQVNSGHIKNGLSSTFWPGRFEIIEKNKCFILDCAHNDASSKALSQAFGNEFSGQKGILIFGASDDKNIKKICAELNGIVEKVVFTEAHHPRAMHLSVDRGKKMFPGKECFIEENLLEAIQCAEKLAGNNIIVITGSIFLVAEARKILLER